MNESIVAEMSEEVKLEELEYIFGDPPSDGCGYDGCHESVFCHGLCWDHFIEEETERWNVHQAERETCLAGVGYR